MGNILNKLKLTAALIAFASASLAQAQSNVTLYGIIDTAIQVGHSGGKTTTRLDSSSVAPSRWGLLGSEDLGGGLSAVFKLEDGFNANTGTIAGNGAEFNREAWVGLRGKFGQVQLGNNYTPLFTTYLNYSLGELNTLAWGNATNNFVFVPTARTANSIRFVSAPVGGALVRLVYARGANGTTGEPASLGDTLSAGINYVHGHFSADADYLQQRFSQTATLSQTSPVATGRYYLFGTSYDWGRVKAAALYQMHRNATGITAAVNSTYANPNNDFYEVNALIRDIAHGTVLLSFGQYRLSANGNGNASSYAIRYDYHLSKRTGVYAGVAEIRNHSAATFSVSNAAGAGIPVTAGSNLTTFIAGIVHKF